MEQLKIAMERAITVEPEVDWLILRKLALDAPVELLDRLKSVDEPEKLDQPFRYHQGYLQINADEERQFEEILTDLVNRYRGDIVQLANLYIIQSRASPKYWVGQENGWHFRHLIGSETCMSLYDLLIDSLNISCYAHSALDQEIPEVAENWQKLFNWSEAVTRSIDALVGVISLVIDNWEDGIDFRFVRKMKPLIRAVMVGTWYLKVAMSKGQVVEILMDSAERAFIAAYIIQRSGRVGEQPEWVDDSVIRRLIFDWQRTGSYFLSHSFGNNVDMRQPDEGWLDAIAFQVISKILATNSEESAQLIDEFVFPMDFVSLFSCIGIKEISYSEIHVTNKLNLLRRFLREMTDIVVNVGEFLVRDESGRGPESWRFGDPKFRDLICGMLLLYLEVGEAKDGRDFEKMCYKIRPLFSGGYKITVIARKLGNFVFLMSLSAKDISDLTEEMLAKVKAFAAIICRTVLVPVVHILEREEEIWNPQYEGVIGLIRSENLLLNDALTELKGSPMEEHYAMIFEAIDNTAVAR